MWTQKDDGSGENVGNGVVSKVGNGNEFAVLDSRLASMSTGPMVSNLNVTKSSKVHIGPKLVSVTQTVQNQEMVKGRFLGLDLVSTKDSRRIRCSVAVFICWALIVACALIVYLIYLALPKQTRLDIGLYETWYLRRDDWQAMNAYSVDFLQLPVPYVIIGHSGERGCVTKYECIAQVLLIQVDLLKQGNDDIAPNFLVGGEDGYVFEGRGANVFSAVLPMYNRRSVTIMFLGNYINDKPNMLQFNHTNILIEALVRHGVLRPDFTVWGYCQVNPETVPPGPNIVNSLGNLTHWNPSSTSGCRNYA